MIMSAKWTGSTDNWLSKNVARDGSVPNITCAWLYPALGQRINREGGGDGRSGGGGRLSTKGATRTFQTAPAAARGCNARPNINNVSSAGMQASPQLLCYMWASSHCLVISCIWGLRQFSATKDCFQGSYGWSVVLNTV